jgi:FAD:protein FMN transferase
VNPESTGFPPASLVCVAVNSRTTPSRLIHYFVALLGRAGNDAVGAASLAACYEGPSHKQYLHRTTLARVGGSWLAALSLLSAVTLHAADLVSLSGRAMGTTWSVRFEPPASLLDQALVQQRVAQRLEDLEQQFSTYRPQSTLSRFNAAPHTEWVDVELELAHVAGLARTISELTGGAFDVTVNPLVMLWGFGGGLRSHSIPSATEISAARERVDWRRVQVRMNPPALRKTEPRTTADFSSIAKGFAADQVSELLIELGAVNHLVQIGGDVKSGGKMAALGGWRTGIEQPLENTRAIAATIVLRGEAVSTSGAYRNFIQIGERRFGHIIDPRTGEPVSGTLAAVSVVHRSCAMSSALATALFVLGADEGYRLAREQKLACLFQVRNGAKIEQRATPEFERFID